MEVEETSRIEATHDYAYGEKGLNFILYFRF